MSDSAPYRVLARKYRPQTFAELVGQEAMVRTLTNAIDSGRIAHAFILTGVRGVGKTTTARIIARALNCTGVDGAGGPSVSPCGTCDACRRIAEDRHVDVQEMDAASRTGIDDIREIIESVRYAPASARFKIYIIDEVHMLSTQAFNGLLKTLEEPPPHVKFIFATTEIRKVPVTVLSRCQRFDLRRIEPEALIRHLADIAAREGVEAEREALALIARAAEGSMRDGLSLLDQAIAHGGGRVLAAAVRDMLGIANRGEVFELYEQVMQGDTPGAIASLERQYDTGADPLVVLQDMLELTHWLTRIKVTPEAANDPTMADEERSSARRLAERLTMPTLSRNWQLLLKGIGEAREAPRPIQAAEMTLIRLAHIADLPQPADLIRQLQGQGGAARGAPAQSAGKPANLRPPPSPPAGAGQRLAAEQRPRPEPAAAVEAEALAAGEPASFAALVAMAGEKRDLRLKAELISNVHLVRFEPGRIEIRPTPQANPKLAGELADRLQQWTGRRWLVTLSRDDGAPTMREQEQAQRASQRQAVESHPLVQAALQAFPGAAIRGVHRLGEGGEGGAAEPGPGETGLEDTGADANFGNEDGEAER